MCFCQSIWNCLTELCSDKRIVNYLTKKCVTYVHDSLWAYNYYKQAIVCSARYIQVLYAINDAGFERALKYFRSRYEKIAYIIEILNEFI